MGTDVGDERDDFLDLVRCAREIVLPGSTGPAVRVPEQRGAFYDVSRGCIDLTDGMPSYGG